LIINLQTKHLCGTVIKTFMWHCDWPMGGRFNIGH